MIIFGSESELGRTFVYVELGSTGLNDHRFIRTWRESEVSCCVISVNSPLNDTLKSTALIRIKSGTFRSV